MGETPSDTAGTNDHQDRAVTAVAPANPFIFSHDSTEIQPPTLDAVLKSSRRVAGLIKLNSNDKDGTPTQRLIGTPLPWDGFSEEQAYYLNVEPGTPIGEYEFTIADVPDGACWSITAYTKNGSGAQNESPMYNLNSHTASSNGDGSITVHFGGSADECHNCLPITDGWNYIIRLYKSHTDAPAGH